MKKGFLLIDEQKNTIILSPKYIEADDILSWLKNSDIRKEIKQHKTKTDLYNDVNMYLKGTYEKPKEV